MPLEIRELVIKVSVNESNHPSQLAGDNLTEKLIEMKSKIVSECIEKIFSKIEKAGDR